jgi:hypothetical protein
LPSPSGNGVSDTMRVSSTRLPTAPRTLSICTNGSDAVVSSPVCQSSRVQAVPQMSYAAYSS